MSRKVYKGFGLLTAIVLIMAMALVGCSETRRVRERIAIDANADCFVNNGYDLVFYSDRRGTQKLAVEGSAGNVDAEGYGDWANWQRIVAPTAIATATPALRINSSGVSALISAEKNATRVWGVSGAGAVYQSGDLDLNGNFDQDGTTTDMELSGAFSIDADLSSNISLSVGDLTLEAETGSIIIKADEATADAVYIDANQAVTTGVTVIVGSSASFKIDGGLTDIGTGTYATADGDNDLGVAGDLEVDGTFDHDGSLDMDGATMDVALSGAFSFDASSTSYFDTSSGDITIEAETGSVIIKGDEAVADAVYIDANDAVTTGVTIVVGSSASLKIDGGLTDIGTGSYGTVNGDNDLGVAGDFEVDGTTDLDGNLDMDATTLDVELSGAFSVDADQASNISLSAGDLTVEAETGTVIVKGDEAAADAVYIDANDAVTTGLTIATGSVSGMNVSGGTVTIATNVLVDGVADAEQLVVQGHSTQTNNPFVVETSAGSDVFTISNAGNTVVVGTFDVQGGDITLQNDETIANSVNGIITATATTFHVEGNTTTSGSLDVQGGDITLQNDETISNSGDGIVDVTATTIRATGNLETTGSLDVQGGTITMQNDEVISNATDTVISISAFTALAEGAVQAVTEGGTITAVASYQPITSTAAVTTSTATAIADGVVNGQLLILVNENAADVIIIDNGANTKLSGNISLGPEDVLMMIWDGADWLEISNSDN